MNGTFVAEMHGKRIHHVKHFPVHGISSFSIGPNAWGSAVCLESDESTIGYAGYLAIPFYQASEIRDACIAYHNLIS